MLKGKVVGAPIGPIEIVNREKRSLRTPNLMEAVSTSEASVTLPTSIRYKHARTESIPTVNPGENLKTVTKGLFCSGTGDWLLHRADPVRVRPPGQPGGGS
jgi:hypothetical protein